MKANMPSDPEELLKEAGASEHQEAYHTIEKTINYRIGVGVRLNMPNPPHFFVEILLYLAPGNDRVDVTHLKKSVRALKQLQTRYSSMVFQDGNCISCEREVASERLEKECEMDKALMKKNFAN